MTNVRYGLEEYKDIEIRNMASERLSQGYSYESVMESIHAKGRDNARTPMQWNAGANAGFTTGEPWIRVNPNYTEINVEAQLADPYSVLNYYRHLVDLRKREDLICDGDYQQILSDRDDIFAYSRFNGQRKLTVVANFSGETVAVPEELLTQSGELEICNYPDAPANGILRPYEAVMYLK